MLKFSFLYLKLNIYLKPGMCGIYPEAVDRSAGTLKSEFALESPISRKKPKLIDLFLIVSNFQRLFILS